MSYQKYSTKSFILHSVSKRETDLNVFILTEDFGLISVRATGIRNTKSKLKPSLLTLGFGIATLIRGRNIWRLVEFDLISKKESVEDISMLARVSSLVLRLVKGEGRVSSFFFALENYYNSDEKDYSLVELFLVSKILSDLGYWGGKNIGDDFLKQKEFLVSEKEYFIKEINSSLRESHL